MDNFRIDIVFPVWNRPDETRNALVSLMAYTPGARFILVDYGSDRETEMMLQEFAEGLAERAFLIRTERNEGFIRALNRGLERVLAPYAGIVRTTTVVPQGWCDDLLRFMDAEPEVGAALPPQAVEVSKRRGADFIETASLSFAAMILRREALESAGLFDAALDGSQLCLKDYACRLHAGGWRIVQAAGPAVQSAPEIIFGSEVRRSALADKARDQVLARWGEEQDFCLQVSRHSSPECLEEQLPMVLAAARQGHRLTLVLPANIHQILVRSKSLPLHTGIRIVPLPRLFAGRATASTLADLKSVTPCVHVVQLGEGQESAAGDATISYDQFAALITERQRERFRR
jgi:hypothetical protein